jgi:hypothetical protein
MMIVMVIHVVKKDRYVVDKYRNVVMDCLFEQTEDDAGEGRGKRR